MRRLAAALLALTLAGCSTNPCQELGERICRCQPGMSEDSCKTQVENQRESLDSSEGYCEQRLDACAAPEGASFCEWLLTADGKDACGLSPANPQ